MSVRVAVRKPTAELEMMNFPNAVTFSVTDGALCLYDRDPANLMRLVRAFAPGQWERAWVEAEG